MANVVIVGHGLVGAQIGHELLERGHEVTWVEAGKQSASELSIGLIKESWLKGLVPDLNATLGHLDARYGLTQLDLPKVGRMFQLEGVRIQRHTPTERIVHGHVRYVDKVPGGYHVCLRTGEYLGAEAVVIATGWWASELSPVVANPHFGEVYAFRTAPAPLIKLWAPYRHLVMVPHCDGYWWCSDGLAVSHITPEQRQRAYRMLTEAGAQDLLWKKTAGRPFTADKLGVCKQTAPGQWVATGGRKSSTVLAAEWAQTIAEAM